MSASRQPPFQRFLDSEREVVWRYLVSALGSSDAEDCFQDTFIAALRAYPRLRADSDARAWVLTIAHRKVLDAHRARARRAVPIAEPLPAGALSETSPSAHEQAFGADAQLWRAVAELPPRQRSAVTLRYVADLRHREIASVIGCSEQAARRSLYEGLTKLRKVVET